SMRGWYRSEPSGKREIRPDDEAAAVHRQRHLRTDCVHKPVEGLSMQGSSGRQQWFFCTCPESGQTTRL
ncbi:MAG: hypothetical protein ABTS22_11370, partial [Accumulibacter sp.]|uniref:hypothetical protein n=1 Tax=Accumulibacter sp. TaxID=2053492 RepID=UPI0033156997